MRYPPGIPRTSLCAGRIWRGAGEKIAHERSVGDLVGHDPSFRRADIEPEADGGHGPVAAIHALAGPAAGTDRVGRARTVQVEALRIDEAGGVPDLAAEADR